MLDYLFIPVSWVKIGLANAGKADEPESGELRAPLTGRATMDAFDGFIPAQW